MPESMAVSQQTELSGKLVVSWARLTWRVWPAGETSKLGY